MSPIPPAAPQEPLRGLLARLEPILVSFSVLLTPRRGSPGPGLVDRDHVEVRPTYASQIPRIMRLLEQEGWQTYDQGWCVTTWPQTQF